MSENNENKSDDGRALAAAIFETAGATAGAVATAVPDPTLRGALYAASSLASIIATLIKSVGASSAHDLIKELGERKDEGRITDAEISADGQKIERELREWFDTHQSIATGPVKS